MINLFLFWLVSLLLLIFLAKMADTTKYQVKKELVVIGIVAWLLISVVLFVQEYNHGLAIDNIPSGFPSQQQK